jgi:HPt (histidine-containing phosphotransfer) domain-containing protein
LLHCITHWTASPAARQSEFEQKKSEPAVIPEDTEYKYVSEQVLQQLVRDTAPDIVPDLLAFYIEDAKKRVRLIQRAVKGKDIKTLEFETHSLSSSAAAHGSEKLHQMARIIEKLCRQNDHEQALKQATGLSKVATKSFRLLTKRAEEGFKSVKQETIK